MSSPAFVFLGFSAAATDASGGRIVYDMVQSLRCCFPRREVPQVVQSLSLESSLGCWDMVFGYTASGPCSAFGMARVFAGLGAGGGADALDVFEDDGSSFTIQLAVSSHTVYVLASAALRRGAHLHGW